MKKILVKDVMTEGLTVASLQHKFSNVMGFFNLMNIRHMPVTDGEKVIGIISVRDVMKSLYERLGSGEPVTMEQMDQQFSIRNIMSMTPVTVNPDTELEDALSILNEGKFHALPVVEDGILKGIVTDYDILKAYFKEKRPPAHYSISSPGFGV